MKWPGLSKAGMAKTLLTTDEHRLTQIIKNENKDEL
jgi:hypothetical protein